jgi:hypothetical protein
MVKSAARTVAEYLRELTPEDRKVISAVRKLVNDNLPDGYNEVMNWGMIVWEIPLSLSGPTYNKQPLATVALAAQKNYYALYLPVFMDPAMEKAFKAAYRKKLDMGKSCLRFKAISELDLETIRTTLADVQVEEMLRLHRRAHPRVSS